MLSELEENTIRFERAIYLHYVETNQHKQFKPISKDDFFKNSNLDKYKSFEFDKDYIYRLADSKTVWYNRNGLIIGESWYDGNLSSYWIKKD